jgi:hypothetical protein
MNRNSVKSSMTLTSFFILILFILFLRRFIFVLRNNIKFTNRFATIHFNLTRINLCIGTRLYFIRGIKMTTKLFSLLFFILSFETFIIKYVLLIVVILLIGVWTT